MAVFTPLAALLQSQPSRVLCRPLRPWLAQVGTPTKHMQNLLKRSILVTGSTDGIGLQTALELAQQGHRVVIHGRNPQRCEQAVKRVKAAGYVAFDLGDRAAITTGATELRERFADLDTVVHNAGVFCKHRLHDHHGIEQSLSINHLGPALLTWHLLPVLRAVGSPQRPARLVFVASVAHHRGRINWADIGLREHFADGYPAYAQSKLANVLFAAALARRLDPAAVTVNSLHPGVVSTKLLKGGFAMEGPDSLADGAATSVKLAAAADVAGITGQYFVRGAPAEPSPQAQNKDEQDRLFAWTCTELQLDSGSW